MRGRGRPASAGRALLGAAGWGRGQAGLLLTTGLLLAAGIVYGLSAAPGGVAGGLHRPLLAVSRLGGTRAAGIRAESLGQGTPAAAAADRDSDAESAKQAPAAPSPAAELCSAAAGTPVAPPRPWAEATTPLETGHASWLDKLQGVESFVDVGHRYAALADRLEARLARAREQRGGVRPPGPAAAGDKAAATAAGRRSVAFVPGDAPKDAIADVPCAGGLRVEPVPTLEALRARLGTAALATQGAAQPWDLALLNGRHSFAATLTALQALAPLAAKHMLVAYLPPHRTSDEPEPAEPAAAAAGAAAAAAAEPWRGWPAVAGPVGHVTGVGVAQAVAYWLALNGSVTWRMRDVLGSGPEGLMLIHLERRSLRPRYAAPIPVLGLPTVANPAFLLRAVRSIDHPVAKLVIIWQGNDPAVGAAIETLQAERGAAGLIVRHYPDNAGCAGGWNRIVEEDPGAAYWIIGNDDIVFPPNSLADIAEESAALSAANSPISVLHTWHQFASGSWSLFSLLARSVREAGPFDENIYPAYQEDQEYSYRLIQAKLDRSHVLTVTVHGALEVLSHESGSKSKSMQAADEGQRFRAMLARADTSDYYTRKWGGVSGHESYTRPFNNPSNPVGKMVVDAERLACIRGMREPTGADGRCGPYNMSLVQ